MIQSGSIISALGAGSGIDMQALATNLANAQFALRSERLTQRSEVLGRQISSASSLKNMLSTLAGSLGDRVRQGDLSSQPKVGNGSVASASSPVGTSGRGSYTLEVTQLAAGQALSGPAMASASDPVGAGTLTLRFGAISGSSFTADAARAPVDIAIASGPSLTEIAAAINGAGAGVTAYIADTAAGPRLMMKGKEGEANGFVLEAAETPGEEGLAQLAWEPAGGDAARLTRGAQDAVYFLDGLQRSSASNTTGQIAPGLALTLNGTNAGSPTQVTFADPSANITTAMQDLVAALNEVSGELRSATNPISGDLSSDPGARALRQRLSRFAGEEVMPTAPAGAPRTLADLGIATERDGSFRLDSARLQATLAADPDGAAAMFTTGLFGVFASFDKLSRAASRTGDPGSLTGSITRYQKQAQDVSKSAAAIAEKQETLRQQLTARFAKSDARISASQSTLSSLQAQIDAWNGNKN